MSNSIRRGLVAVGLTAIMSVAGSSCAAGPQAPQYEGANVVLVTLDTTRASRLGAYGYAAAETPHLDALAAAGVRFVETVAPVPLTLPSHTSLMTSTDPPTHGVRDNGTFDISPDLTMLAESLQGAGYDTGAFVGAYVLHQRWGLNRGFDEYDDQMNYGSGDTAPGQVERRGDAVMDVALPWIESRGEAPFFAWVHLYDPHAPYDAPEPYAGRHEQAYDAEIAFTDSLIGRLMETLEAGGKLENTIVVVTADHGESLGDHGEMGHGLFVYDSTMLIPLFIRLPDEAAAGLAVEPSVRLIDVAPTILELAAVEIPSSFEGETLTPFLIGGGSARTAYSETFFPRFHFGWQELHALRGDGMKYILAPRPELYDLIADPGETDNLVASRGGEATALRTTLEAIRDAGPAVGPGQLSAEAAANLRALGYIGSAPADLGDGPLADPKDKVDLVRRLTLGQSLLGAGDAQEAIEVLEGVIAEDDGIVDAHFTLGNALFGTGDYGRAIAAFESTLALQPEYDQALSNLGLARLQSGDVEGARADFEALLSLVPGSPSAHFHLGEISLAAGEAAEARRHFEASLETNRQTPASHFGLAVAAFQLGDLPASRAALRETVALFEFFPEAHFYLGLIAEAEQNPTVALDEYRVEVEHNPGNFRAWFNQSLLLADRRDYAGAVVAAERAVEIDPESGRALVSLGRFLVGLNDPARLSEAIGSAQRGLELDPEPLVEAMGHFVLADAYNRLGQPAEAQRHAELGRQAQRAIQR